MKNHYLNYPSHSTDKIWNSFCKKYDLIKVKVNKMLSFPSNPATYDNVDYLLLLYRAMRSFEEVHGLGRTLFLRDRTNWV